jgi:hypothetical protein
MRQFGCVEMGLKDALLLRDAIRPLTKVELYNQVTLVHFCQKLYDGILKLRADEKLEAVNLPLEEHEAIIVNHFIGYEDWDGAGALLEQSWLVLYELRHAEVYPRTREEIRSTLQRISTESAGSFA